MADEPQQDDPQEQEEQPQDEAQPEEAGQSEEAPSEWLRAGQRWSLDYGQLTSLPASGVPR